VERNDGVERNGGVERNDSVERNGGVSELRDTRILIKFPNPVRL
jgi:hypothetical protein